MNLENSLLFLQNYWTVLQFCDCPTFWLCFCSAMWWNSWNKLSFNSFKFDYNIYHLLSFYIINLFIQFSDLFSQSTNETACFNQYFNNILKDNENLDHSYTRNQKYFSFGYSIFLSSLTKYHKLIKIIIMPLTISKCFKMKTYLLLLI